MQALPKFDQSENWIEPLPLFFSLGTTIDGGRTPQANQGLGFRTNPTSPFNYLPPTNPKKKKLIIHVFSPPISSLFFRTTVDDDDTCQPRFFYQVRFSLFTIFHNRISPIGKKNWRNRFSLFFSFRTADDHVVWYVIIGPTKVYRPKSDFSPFYHRNWPILHWGKHWKAFFLVPFLSHQDHGWRHKAQPRFRPIRPPHKPTLTNQKNSAIFLPPPPSLSAVTSGLSTIVDERTSQAKQECFPPIIIPPKKQTLINRRNAAKIDFPFLSCDVRGFRAMDDVTFQPIRVLV